jgi:hypothetical protein
MTPSMKANPRNYTSKQMGDACEMFVAAELTLAGIPSLKVPDAWPGYDVISHPSNGSLQRVSVKSRTFKRGPAYLEYDERDEFEWLAIVILPGEDETRRRVFVVPRAVADQRASRNTKGKNIHFPYFKVEKVATIFEDFEANFTLSTTGRQKAIAAAASVS